MRTAKRIEPTSDKAAVAATAARTTAAKAAAASQPKPPAAKARGGGAKATATATKAAKPKVAPKPKAATPKAAANPARRTGGARAGAATTPLLVGVHTVDNGGIHMAALRAGHAGARALQVFTAPPRFYGDKASIQPARVARFHAALAEVGIRPEHVMVHGAYVLNVASPEAEKHDRSAAGLVKELERSTALGAGAACFHPGSAGSGGDRAAALARVAAAITAALRAVPGPTRLLVENTAGAGNTVARTAEEVAGILSLVPRELRSRTGYGLDTCHLFASGYDLRASPAALAAVLDEFERQTGSRRRSSTSTTARATSAATATGTHCSAAASSASSRSAGCSPTAARAASC